MCQGFADTFTISHVADAFRRSRWLIVEDGRGHAGDDLSILFA